ncbi:MAG: hypothetical protein KBC58_07685 [Flavobacterium sp.]|nr:hypothetical protein [Flavobacterium sp.]
MTVNYKQIVRQIEERQHSTFCAFNEFDIKKLPRKRRGLYWIWTSLSLDELANAPDDTSKGTKKVPLAKLIKQRKGLENICGIRKENFTLVYNGIGGYNSETKNFGLRERLLQEFNATNSNTGSLNITERYKDKSHWAISFFDFDDINNQDIIALLESENPYLDFASDLEKLWRLEFGHPILCRY